MTKDQYVKQMQEGHQLEIKAKCAIIEGQFKEIQDLRDRLVKMHFRYSKAMNHNEALLYALTRTTQEARNLRWIHESEKECRRLLNLDDPLKMSS